LIREVNKKRTIASRIGNDSLWINEKDERGQYVPTFSMYIY
jgi:hypothetical protein